MKMDLILKKPKEESEYAFLFDLLSKSNNEIIDNNDIDNFESINEPSEEREPTHNLLYNTIDEGSIHVLLKGIVNQQMLKNLVLEDLNEYIGL